MLYDEAQWLSPKEAEQLVKKLKKLIQNDNSISNFADRFKLKTFPTPHTHEPFEERFTPEVPLNCRNNLGRLLDKYENGSVNAGKFSISVKPMSWEPLIITLHEKLEIDEPVQWAKIIKIAPNSDKWFLLVLTEDTPTSKATCKSVEVSITFDSGRKLLSEYNFPKKAITELLYIVSFGFLEVRAVTESKNISKVESTLLS